MLGKLNPFVRFVDKIESARLAHEAAAHDCRLFYVEEGSFDFEFNGQHHRIGKSDAVYLPPYTPFVVRGTSSAMLTVLHFDLTGKNEEYEESLQVLSSAELAVCCRLEQEVFAPFDAPLLVRSVDLQAYLDAVNESMRMPSSYVRELVSCHVKGMLLCLAEAFERENGISPLAKQIMDYVHKNFADAEVTNQEIAARFGYHPYHISRVMRKETGKTLKAYIISYRLEAAVNMLALTDMSIAEIAHACGFESQSYFSKMFRDEFAITPGEYRKAHTEHSI